MLAALLALFAAVATTLVYLLLTEEMDYSSMRRRQIDAWAAITAIACMAVILYGNASGRRYVPEMTPRPPSEIDAPAIPRLGTARPPVEMVPASTRTAASSEILVAIGPVGEEALQDPDGSDDPTVTTTDGVASVEDSPVSPVEPTDVLEKPRGSMPTPMLAGASPTVPPRVTASDGPPPELSPGWPALPTSAKAILPPTTEVPPPSATPEPTTLPFASPTPHCGDPAAIDLAIGDLNSEVDRHDDQVFIRFHFDVRNDSDFPVTLTRMAVTAQAGSGTETFGSTRLHDVTIQPGAVYPVEDRVLIERGPAPNERLHMCVSFVPETCGLARIERRYGSRCWENVAGF